MTSLIRTSAPWWLAFAVVALVTTLPLAAQGGPPEAKATKGRNPTRARIPVTSAMEASAFTDPKARTLLLAARDARLRQDSALMAYDAMAYSRLSMGMALRSIAKNRLAFRKESSAHVRWQRGVGAWIDVTGSRAVVPMAQGVDSDVQFNIPSIPYYPGRDALWAGGGIARAEVNPDEIIHPLASGSEAYYHYASGDSLTISLGAGKTIVLRELRVSARRPEWRLIVGSFWFDIATAQLVRAAYRFSVPMDIRQVAEEEDKESFDDVPTWVKPMIFPMTATADAITVEYGLFNGFWLPRTQAFSASAQVSFMRVPVTYEERFKYASVNARDTTLPAIPLSARRRLAEAQGDSVTAEDEDDDEFDGEVSLSVGGKASSVDDSIAVARAIDREERRAKRRAARRDTSATAPPKTSVPPLDSAQRAARRQRAVAVTDSVKAARAAECAATGFRMRTSRMYEGALLVATRTPCDNAALATSPDLPPSIYNSGEELFGATEREALMKELGFGLQAGSAMGKPTLDFSLADGSIRYNRIEGLSVGASVWQELGNGYRATASGRIGLADREPNAELGATRTNGRRTLGVNLYRRLSVASDWGQPLAFGASLASLLYGRDEGFYYRSLGAEVTYRTEPNGATALRLFAEQQDNAAVQSRFTLTQLGTDSRVIANVAARVGTVAGAEVRDRRAYGLNPLGWRLVTDTRVEGGTGAWDYLRGLADATVSKGITERGAVAVTVAGGTSAGALPPQRQFFLGALQTVRGQVAGAMQGSAFWFTRSEVAFGPTVARPSVYFDVGWAGDRAQFRTPGVPMKGVGAGLSTLDGMFRLDLARGLAPTKQWRLDLSVEARF